jgi:acyl-CoA synthetase (AMP-forming)/AMP-acid ligase II
MVEAAVVLNPRASSEGSVLLDWLRDRVGGYKRPRRILIVEELARTGTGKVKRERPPAPEGS